MKNKNSNMKTLTFPFGSDCKFTLIPKLGEQVLEEADMVDLEIKVINRNRGVDFIPEWAWRDTGIEIEIQRENIKSIGSYQVSIDWRRPDQTYSDDFQDILNSCTVIEFVDSCKIPEKDTVVIDISPIYKGDKGDSAYQVWLSEGNTGTIEDYLDWLQKPATDAGNAVIGKVEELDALMQTVSLNEQGRSQNELFRISAEDQRVLNETSRVNAETDRLSAETTRDQNETTRIQNEEARISAENIRSDAESVRVSGETSRKAAETQREQAETTRQQNADQAINDVNEAKEAAETAATNADEKAAYAEEQGDYAKEQAEIIEGYELIESEEYLETIFNDI